MKIEILIIGDELLNGSKNDANGQFLALFLQKKGLSLSKISIITDNKEQIERALSHSMKTSDIVFLSGGLGPTNDDITKKVLADFFNLKLKEDDNAKSIVNKHYQRISRKWNLQNGYHLIPEGFTAVFNHKGLAPGLVYKKKGKYLLAAPGVPLEFSAMVEKEFYPWLLENEKILLTEEKISMTIRTSGVPEEKIFKDLAPRLWSDLKKWGKVASLPHIMGVDIVVSNLENIQKKLEIEDFLKTTPIYPHIWQIGTVPLNEWVLQIAKKLQLTVVLAESCTGGALANRLTDIAGSSCVFKGGVVTYSKQSKQSILGVSKEVMDEYGVVSKQTACQMAKGVRRVLKGDVALALSGVTGPGDSEGIPQGTLAIGWDSEKISGGELLQMKGDRLQLKERFVQKGLHTLLQIIKK